MRERLSLGRGVVGVVYVRPLPVAASRCEVKALRVTTPDGQPYVAESETDVELAVGVARIAWTDPEGGLPIAWYTPAGHVWFRPEPEG